MLKGFFFSLSLALAVWAEPIYNSQGLSFQLPLAFSQPARAGMGAEELHFPAEAAEAGEVKAEVITFLAGPEQVRSMAEAGQSIDRYFATTYLGVSGLPEQVNKAVIGDQGGRHLVYHSALGRPSRVDIFERELPDGRFMAVALRTYGLQEEARIELSEALRKSLRVVKPG
ncbi:MAG: hypothetical protein U0931_04715 [Vulcanimicrobiota bacterium]